MHIGRIEGTTRVIGKQQGYYGLPLRDDWAVTQPNRAGLILEARSAAQDPKNLSAEYLASLLTALANELTVLPIADGHQNDSVTGPETPVMTTAWLPEPGELIALANGSAIHVTLVGRTHPPIRVGVGPLPT